MAMTIELTAILAKTAKGNEEISTRQNHLPFRARAMLIMVDGRRTGGELVAQSVFGAEAEEYLAVLLDGGFIAPQSTPSLAPDAIPLQSKPVQYQPGQTLRPADPARAARA